MKSYIIPAKLGFACELKRGEHIRIIDLEGQQVADFVAYTSPLQDERLDPSVTMDVLQAYRVAVGDGLYSNRYRKLLTVTRDDVGQHDLFNSSCRKEMYEFTYDLANHRSCYDNLNEVLEPYGVAKPDQHYALNIFMHTVLATDGSMVVKRPKSRAGDVFEMRAEVDLVIGISNCPCSESACNGFQCTALGVEVGS